MLVELWDVLKCREYCYFR